MNVLFDKEAYALLQAKITLYEEKDGSIEIFYMDKSLDFSTCHSQQKQGEVVDSKTLNRLIDNLQNKQQKQNTSLPIIILGNEE